MTTLERQRILVTFPGRAGDLLWALPTVRAIAELAQHPVDLQMAGEFSGMVELLRQQEYLSHVCANPHWTLTPPDDWRAPDPVGTPERTYDQVIHLGYRGWPDLPLPFQVQENAKLVMGEYVGVDLHRPWITVPPYLSRALAVGWTDCHFELKFGLSQLLFSSREAHPFWEARLLPPPGSRWVTEGLEAPVGWLEAARYIAGASCFVGDCSALHVLAVALGKRVVCYEPMQERLNDIFWPLGKDGPQVTLVRGNDGEMTTDSRHVEETLGKVMGEVQRYGR